MSETKCTLVYQIKDVNSSKLVDELFEITCEESAKYIDCYNEDDAEIEKYVAEVRRICSALEAKESVDNLIEEVDIHRYRVASDTITEKNGFKIVHYSSGSDFTIPHYLKVLAEIGADFGALISNFEHQTESFYKIVDGKVEVKFYDAENSSHDNEHYEGIREWWYSDYPGWNYNEFPFGEFFPDSKPNKNRKSGTPTKRTSGQTDDLATLLKENNISCAVIETMGAYSKFMKNVSNILEKYNTRVIPIHQSIEVLNEIHENEFQLMLISCEFARENNEESLDTIKQCKAEQKEWMEDDSDYIAYDYKVVVFGNAEDITDDLVNKVDGSLTVPPAKVNNSDIEKIVTSRINEVF